MSGMLRSWLAVAACAVVSTGFAQRPALSLSVDPLAPVPKDQLWFLLQRFELPRAYDYQRLGAFCKLDVQLEKRLGLPVRLRLGDPWLVDALEGKGPLRLVDPR